jgi:chromosome segregation protein
VFGFKSFMDRVKLRFGDGITGIVGPNGCGKSNIVDAIRWVMGEQSARILRGKNMEDIIFSGSETKPSMGMAEVHITFENDGRNVPPEYASYSEITVGRRLFRSGESEYFINRTPCRLLDVQELFMGTGVGTKAYSIIGQGQIGLLVSQKPSERRSLIEEAAGISKYKARKKVAERKMDQTRQNLLRIHDVVSEIKRNIDSLQRQAKKAARFNRIREQIKGIELHLATHRFLELDSTCRFQRARQNHFSMRESQLHSENASREASIEQRRVQLLEQEHQLSDVQERLLSTDNQIKLNEQNIDFLSREIESFTSRGQQSAKEIDAMRTQLFSLTEELEKNKHELQELNDVAASSSTRLRERESICQSQSKSYDELMSRFDGDRQAQLKQGEHIGESRSLLASLDQRLVDLERRNALAQAERNELTRQHESLMTERQHQSERLAQLRLCHTQLKEHRESEENTQAELQTGHAENEARCHGLRDEIGKKRSRLESLLQIEHNYEGCLSGVRSVMQNIHQRRDDSQVLGLVADILQSPPRYETAVQAVLGDRLQSVVVRSQDAGLAAVDYLKTEAEGRSSFIPLSLRGDPHPSDTSKVLGPGVIGPMRSLLDFKQEYESVVKYLLGDVIVVEDLSTAMNVWTANGNKATLVTLEGDVLEPEGVLTGGSLEGPGAHLLKNKREIRELEEKLRDLEAQHLIFQDLQGKMKLQLTTVGSSIDSLKQNSHEEEIRIVDQEKDLNHVDSELRRFSSRLQELDVECDNVGRELARCRQEKDDTQKHLDESITLQADYEARIREGRATQEEEKMRLAELTHEVLNLKVQAAASIERKESATRQVENLQKIREELEQRIERTRSDLSNGNLHVHQNKERIDGCRKEISLHLAGREKDQSIHSEIRERYERLLADVRNDELKAKEERKELDQVISQLGQLNIRIREIELDMAHAEENVRRSYKVDLVSCLYDFHLCPPPGEDDLRKAEKLRAALERMGDVNPNAVEEYEQLKQRYEFLNTQAQDLTDSLDKLEKVIHKINRASRKKFKEAFDAINEKFQEIFPRLFNGGRAHLAFDETQDLLEAGVEIVAQPPGKRLQSIELLSGGEKALTAVGLLFSIFLVKPTPFCLLDEVDAPLDDVNIDRFNHMVQEMSKGSQFILITHNKRTMELLDRLYGVTMEEPGISTIVSVQFKEQSGKNVEEAA